MTETDIAGLMHATLMVIMKLGGPILGVALIAGMAMSIIQAVTQINEPTLAFLPKLVAIGAALMLFGPFMATTLMTFSRLIFDRLVAIGGS